MPETASGSNKIYIGLCLAGAVSAGAYTAGVMDYLLEALEVWEKRKKANAPDTPQHQVVIPVIGGASAGGMTGIITAASLNNPIIPIKEPLPDILQERPENKLYHSWVDLLGRDMFSMMLQTDDMQDNEIISLLNSSFIDRVADRAIKIDPAKWREMPPYFTPNLKVFTTLTNLEGFGYNVGLRAGSKPEKYYMAIHNDYACFKMQNDGDGEDGWMYLDFKTNTHTEEAKNAAMATGAFPVGLKSRRLKRRSAHVNKMSWCEEVTKYFPVEEPDCETLNVDGGMINNEPFDKVREVLVGITSEQKDQYNNEKTFRSTVLMIDPFPSKEPGTFRSSEKLFDVIGHTFNAMIEQMRAKPGLLTQAMDDNCSGQFLIAPTRRVPKLNGGEHNAAGDEAIACGALGGFSGFISKEFRVHDYFLGRFNCEMFLRDYFTVSAEALKDNPVFASYNGIDKELFKSSKKEGHYQIIPIFTPHPPQNYFPIPKFSSGSTWPVISEKEIDAFRPLMKKRVQALMLNAVKLNGLNKFLVWIGSRVVLNRVLTNTAMNTIKKALNKHQLLALKTPIEEEVVEPG